jgi:VWFA-related protein
MRASRIVSFTFATLLAVVLGHAVGLSAQQATFKGGVELVPLTVTVTDKTGRYLNGLAADDFTVLEDGVRQPVTFFTNERVATDVALVLDVSGSMVDHIRLISRAAVGLVQSLKQGDRASVVAVRKYVAMPQPLTSDLPAVVDAITGLSASGETALYDGVYIALKDLERARQTGDVRKQVIVLLSDGLDTSSHMRLDEISKYAISIGVSIYVIAAPLESWAALPDRVLGRVQYDLRSLGLETGGRLFAPATIAELPDVCAAIAFEFANQYELAYVPQKPARAQGFRRVTVQVANAIARTRAGYYAAARP